MWDSQIQSLCLELNTLIDKITAAHPEWSNKTLEEILSSN